MTDTCCRRRSRLSTPLAMLLGALLVSGTSAYAAAQITGAQIKDGTVTSADVANNSLTFADIKDGYVIGNDLQNETLTGAKIKNFSLGATELGPGAVTSSAVKDGAIGAADLAPGLANRLTAVNTSQAQSADLVNSSNWQWALPTDKLFTYKVTALQAFTVQGVVGYKTPAALSAVDVAVCSSVDGSDPVFMGPTYGTISTVDGQRFNVPVQATTTASGVALRVGPCIRASSGSTFIADVSSMTVLMTNP